MIPTVGYNLHITRAPRWWDSEAHPIPAAEWRRLIESDPELHPATDISSGTGSDRRVPVCFTGDGGAEEPLWFDSGRVHIKNPLPTSLRKLKQIADALGARVFGDDGEEYGAEAVIQPAVPGSSGELVALVKQLCDPLLLDRGSSLAAFRALPDPEIRTAIEQLFLDISSRMPGVLEEDAPDLVQALSEVWPIAEDLYKRERATGAPAAKSLVEAVGRRRAAPVK
jgi:hypothetical protein